MGNKMKVLRWEPSIFMYDINLKEKKMEKTNFFYLCTKLNFNWYIRLISSGAHCLKIIFLWKFVPFFVYSIGFIDSEPLESDRNNIVVMKLGPLMKN